ncbi:MAG: hypothetical protein KGH69_04935 [Candidatus Micrarchaeota archaeon]|nr:hypothetical protein [Candidatus Micrarchaeota archaeon]
MLGAFMPSGREYGRFFGHFFVAKGRNTFVCRACKGSGIKGIGGAIRHMEEMHMQRASKGKKGKVHFDVILGNVEMNE